MAVASSVGARRVSRSVCYGVAGIILLGVILRLRQYSAGRSLWMDEAMLALNIVHRSWEGLTHPLSYNQAAPIGFLFAEKLFVQVFGNRDFILRLVPFLGGIVSLVWMHKVANDFVTRSAGFVVLGLFAVSERLIYFSTEVKPYCTDVLFAVLLYASAHLFLKAQDAKGRWLPMGILGAVSLWFSFPAIFVLAGIGLGLSLHSLQKKDRRRTGQLAAALLMWIVSFGLLYWAVLRRGTHDAHLQGYWQDSFMPMPPWRNLKWIMHAWTGMLQNPVGMTSPWFDTSSSLIGRASVWAGCGLIAVGCLSFFRREWVYGVMLVTPLALVLLASGFHQYPFADRLLLFTLPSIFLLLAEGADRIRFWLRPVPWLSISVFAVLVGILFVAPVANAVQRLQQPHMKENIKPVLAFLETHKRDGDVVYLYYGAKPAFMYYAPFYALKVEDCVMGIEDRENPQKYIEDLDRFRGRDRVWIVISHDYNWGPRDEVAYVLGQVDQIGTKLDAYESTGASVYLYDLRGKRIHPMNPRNEVIP